MASDRLGLSDWFSAHRTTDARIVGEARNPISGSFPVAGLPRLLGSTFIDFAIKRLYLKTKLRGSVNFRPASNPWARIESLQKYAATEIQQLRDAEAKLGAAWSLLCSRPMGRAEAPAPIGQEAQPAADRRACKAVEAIAGRPPVLAGGFRSSLKDKDDDIRRFRDMFRCSDQKT
jgi:hypothetical protein